MKELIDLLLVECGERDPSEVDVFVECFTLTDVEESKPHYIDSRGGNEYPFEIIIKA